MVVERFVGSFDVSRFESLRAKIAGLRFCLAKSRMLGNGRTESGDVSRASDSKDVGRARTSPTGGGAATGRQFIPSWKVHHSTYIKAHLQQIEAPLQVHDLDLSDRRRWEVRAWDVAGRTSVVSDLHTRCTYLTLL